ncbi:MAG: inositol 2-dehydrogenase [Chloroflexota bacterium]|nr:inositol 2-dehydrogenase [Chloroflexota bacterium]
MSARPRVALIGCGRIGQVHLRNLLAHPERCELAALVDANEPALRTIATDYRLTNVSTDPSIVFDDPTIDAVIIASSTETHATYITEAARTGKSTFTEKPIALDLESTDRALAAVDEAGSRLQVGFQRRFDRGYAAARQAIQNGDLGAIEMIRDAMRDPAPPPLAYLEKSGGLYRDMTIHNFDCVRWLKGEEPVEIFAMASALTGGDVLAGSDIDTSIVSMRFADGSLGSIENSRRSGFGYDVRTEVFGAEGALHVGDSRQTPVRHFDASGVREDHQYFFLERFRDAYEAEILSFLQAIIDDTDVAVTGADGRAALRLAIMAETSRQLGRPVASSDFSSEIEIEPVSRMITSA